MAWINVEFELHDWCMYVVIKLMYVWMKVLYNVCYIIVLLC